MFNISQDESRSGLYIIARLNIALKYHGLLDKKASSATYKNLASSMVSAVKMQK